LINDKEQVVELEVILKIQAVSENPHFDSVEFI
jgi:hypothetical protein